MPFRVRIEKLTADDKGYERGQDIYNQTFEELDVKKVIKAANGFPVEDMK